MSELATVNHERPIVIESKVLLLDFDGLLFQTDDFWDDLQAWTAKEKGDATLTAVLQAQQETRSGDNDTPFDPIEAMSGYSGSGYESIVAEVLADFNDKNYVWPDARQLLKTARKAERMSVIVSVNTPRFLDIKLQLAGESLRGIPAYSCDNGKAMTIAQALEAAGYDPRDAMLFDDRARTFDQDVRSLGLGAAFLVDRGGRHGAQTAPDESVTRITSLDNLEIL